MQNYVFEWIDNLVNYELNPFILNPFPLPAEKAEELITKLSLEKPRLEMLLQSLFFENQESKKTKAVIRKYYDELIILLNQVYGFRRHELAERAGLTKIHTVLITSLKELTDWFEFRYKPYLSLERRYPVTSLMRIRESILDQREPISRMLRETGNSDAAISVVTNALDAFVKKIDGGEIITHHEAEYHKELMRDIQRSQGKHSVNSDCPPLHELLVYWNLNTKDCITYFTKGLEAIVGSLPGVNEQLDYLHLQQKNIASMVEIPNFIYNPRYPSIKKFFLDYVENEIHYLEHKAAGFLPNADSEQESEKETKEKVLSTLSVDQLSLVVRAAKDVGFFIAKSLNALFKQIVPFVATEQTANISADSMRSKSYAAEARDKEVVIALLEQMIDRIREY